MPSRFLPTRWPGRPGRTSERPLLRVERDADVQANLPGVYKHDTGHVSAEVCMS